MDRKRLRSIDDVDKYFRKDPKSKKLIFQGDELKAYVPKRFETYGFLTVTETVQTIGIMELIFGGKERAGLHLLGLIELHPSSYETEVIDGLEYMVLTFYKGDAFLTNTAIVKNQALIYAVYTEFIDRGKMIHTMNYDDLLWLFDSAAKMCGASLPMDHAMFEIIYAHLTRLESDPFTPYRQSEMKGDFSLIPLRAVSFAPDSTTARLMGSYFSDSTMASLLIEEKDRKNFEDLLRGIPTEKSQDKYN